MAFRPLDLMEPEETVGNLWHGLAGGIGAAATHPGAAATLAGLRPSLGLLLRALGGAAGIEITEAPAARANHRLPVARKLGAAHEVLHLPFFDGERLRLPPVIDAYRDPALNRAAYMWLTALAAVADIPAPAPRPNPAAADMAWIVAIIAAEARARVLCPGLLPARRTMGDLIAARCRPHLPGAEAAVERALIAALSGNASAAPGPAPRGYRPPAPVPFWPMPAPPTTAGERPEHSADPAPAPAAATTKRKLAARKTRDEANRRDSFIIHRFEAILSWVESMNLNRMIDDDDKENAAKAADDQDEIILSRHDRKAATKLRMHLDLSPADAEHERLSGVFTYPEWDRRTRTYMPDHCRVLEADAPTAPNSFAPDPRALRRVRAQFEALRPRRIRTPRQIEGEELDLDAVIAARAEMAATGRGSDRIYQASRATDRDLCVAVLMDTSRSTEAAIGDTSVIDVAREALAALAGGIDAAGDRLGVWGFSSLRRDRVFLTRCKTFAEPMSADVTARICGLSPGHYTRLGAAMRHVSAQLAQEGAAKKLLLVLTDGKPNDLDHYEGPHGIEDSAMAVREARRAGQTVHGVIIDLDGQDWFARIFGRGGFSLLPDPGRLTRALPDIYRSLIKET
ncbi:MAG: nitric oxide reductase NorD protein [Paracoccaceae bacterium]|jgi:nitric oxide reductase NorD protein